MTTDGARTRCCDEHRPHLHGSFIKRDGSTSDIYILPTPSPSLAEFLPKYEANDNEWWYLQCGDHQNLFEEAVDQVEKLRSEVEHAQVEARAGAEMIRAILVAVCERDGLSLDSEVDPGTPARNYELALRLHIGPVFGIENDD